MSIAPSSYVAEADGVADPSLKYDMNEVLFKVLVIGDYGVGKTAIIRRYTQGIFNQNYKITIGVDFAIKSLQWDEKTLVTLQLWDIAGHERFGKMTRVYYKYATAAIIVFDLSRLATMDSVVKWHKDVKEKVTQQNGQPIPVIILANKCDIHGVTVECDVLNQFCKQHNILAWFFTSAKEDINIKEAVEFLVDRIIYLNKENHKESLSATNPTIQLTSKKLIKKKKKCC